MNHPFAAKQIGFAFDVQNKISEEIDKLLLYISYKCRNTAEVSPESPAQKGLKKICLSIIEKEIDLFENAIPSINTIIQHDKIPYQSTISFKKLNAPLMIYLLKVAKTILTLGLDEIVKGNVPFCHYKSNDLIVLNDTNPTILGTGSLAALRLALLTLCSVIQGVPVGQLDILGAPGSWFHSNSSTVSSITIWNAWQFPELHNLVKDSIFGVNTKYYQGSETKPIFYRGILNPMHCLDPHPPYATPSSEISYVNNNQSYISSVLSLDGDISAAILFAYATYPAYYNKRTDLQQKLEIVTNKPIKVGDILVRYNPNNTEQSYIDEGGTMGIVLGCTKNSLNDPNKGFLTLEYSILKNTRYEEKGWLRGFGLRWNRCQQNFPQSLPDGEQQCFLRPKSAKIEESNLDKKSYRHKNVFPG